MPRKVKVVDVVPDNNDTNTDNAVHELEPIREENQQTDTKEQVEDNETQSEIRGAQSTPIRRGTDAPSSPVKENIEKPTETDTKTEDIVEEDVPKTKVRTNELHECPKCHKFMTLKTLKYTHEKTCGVYQPPPPKPKPKAKPKGRPKKQIVVEKIEEQPVEQKKEAPEFTPEPVKSFEDMRRERLRQRVQQRNEKMHNLFLQAF